MKKAYQRFLIKNRNKGIPNLMLYLGLSNALLYLFTLITQNINLYNLLRFDVALIFRGQVWRTVTWLITYGTEAYLGSPMGLIWICFYVLFNRWLGQLLETVWGTLRLNFYYLGQALMFILVSLLYGWVLRYDYAPSAYYLSLSMFLAVATIIPDERILLFGLLPIKMRWLAWLDLLLLLPGFLSIVGAIGTVSIVTVFLAFLAYPYLAVYIYLLTFKKDVLNLLPLSWQPGNRKRRAKFKQAVRSDPHWADQYRSKDDPHRPARHKCTVCGRTDVDSPGLEFRYCSRCKGFYCYCSDHINNHAHIE